MRYSKTNGTWLHWSLEKMVSLSWEMLRLLFNLGQHFLTSGTIFTYDLRASHYLSIVYLSTQVYLLHECPFLV